MRCPTGVAEIILGRGSFTESFPLFGYRLDDYDVLFEEKLQLFAELLKDGPVTWSGTTRPPLDGQRAYPTTESGSLRAWVGVGGSPESVVRAARYGFPLVLAIIGGPPRRFAPYVELYTTRSPSSAIPIARLPFTRPDTSRSRTSRPARSFAATTPAFHARIGRERGLAAYDARSVRCVHRPRGRPLRMRAPERSPPRLSIR